MDNEIFESLEQEIKSKNANLKNLTLRFYYDTVKPYLTFIFLFFYSIFYPMKRVEDENDPLDANNRNTNRSTNVRDRSSTSNRTRPGFRYRSRGGG